METEKQQLVLQLKATTEANRELQKYNEECDHEYSESDQESSKHENGKKHDDENRTNGEASLISVLDGKDDVLELHRIKKRLAQVENELKRTRTKLLSAQATMKVSQISQGFCIISIIIIIIILYIYLVHSY